MRSPAEVILAYAEVAAISRKNDFSGKAYFISRSVERDLVSHLNQDLSLRSVRRWRIELQFKSGSKGIYVAENSVERVI